MQRDSNLAEIKEWFIKLELSISASTKLRHFSELTEVENLLKGLLNLIHDCGLENANLTTQVNQDSFDLQDLVKKWAVQVTVTQTSAKIRNTLKTFVPNHAATFTSLQFVYPCMRKSSSKVDYSRHLNGFDFDTKRDRIDLEDLLLLIQRKDVKKQKAILELLREELAAVGAPVQMGVDANVETIISVIRYISEGPSTPNPKPDLGPDGEKKLRRFQEHAVYLKRQFSVNVGCYRAVEEARNAVGYDSVRADRCAAWLREKSESALEETKGNAREAFELLVANLCEYEHKAGRNCEENAVRFFLAFELGVCNVFPDPTTQDAK